MYKNWFFRRVDRFFDWLENHQKSIYSISLTIFLLLAAGVGGYISWRYWNNPMFADPGTIIEHMANIPLITGMLAMVLILAGGSFVIWMSLSMIKKVKINKMEFDISDSALAESRIQQRFTFISSMLEQNIEILSDIYEDKKSFKRRMEEDTVQQEIISYLASDYRDYIRVFYPDLQSELFILSTTENMDQNTTRMYKFLLRNEKTQQAVYSNRLINGENTLVGLACFEKEFEGESEGQYKVETDEHIIIVMKTGFDLPFEQYDIDALQSIINYSKILYEELMITYYLDTNEVIKEK
ncbi:MULTISPECIES: hypothetical protein [Halobacillus]|uniref:Uncharacterized protein n=1 Tax=Halobacillus halophilus (strain ATCC 35676 / DSM 2266 / JCM 20832 / KCTC 3685 / LMG 17431 / NBRC 102448 / NCIMB 2269) TaxID=866895 RepID=I0JRF3_HALH3|nr:hypothetical protein [Halobacillus halophilus]ASF40699.1 hypothetical protein CEH05_16680 [Halobacillus halophilus]CCG46723.1 hypothetical protein HBHAL_4383 [Halobacillus halophilus DSM 2266]